MATVTVGQQPLDKAPSVEFQLENEDTSLAKISVWASETTVECVHLINFLSPIDITQLTEISEAARFENELGHTYLNLVGTDLALDIHILTPFATCLSANYSAYANGEVLQSRAGVPLSVLSKSIEEGSSALTQETISQYEWQIGPWKVILSEENGVLKAFQVVRI